MNSPERTENEDFLRRLLKPSMTEVFTSIQSNLDAIPLDSVIQGLTLTSRQLQHVANPRMMASASLQDWREALMRLRSIRRWLPTIEKQLPFQQFIVFLTALIEMDEDVDDQVRALGLSLPMLSKEAAHDIAIEFLHFYSPKRYPLATTWVYSWKTGTGALPYLLEFTNEPGFNGKDRFRAFGAGYSELFARLEQLDTALEQFALHRWGMYSNDIVLAYVYADYLYKMYFTTSKSIFSTIPTVLGVVSYLLGLPIPKEAVPTGIPVEQENSPVS
ncbi:hypothetical protein [Sulfobacillus thermosulfidooxidans]|uniref:Uncharacterized protein n=1 Tax=Sulfobacillus thermosulfidooxidans (strain DSM 9293 / VKM B-1269 / AT-1) TaxID=929705 RepID=A0A1W1WAJ3_SULTA|nr:hypothetical protein [Sulfobacillus thermosulfidooxidans]OLZ11941.1 hypothetical protein BFX05_05545 [Sulfobacillus thermosulfidooxidans]OLZ17624.1 hypothetical protein BFX06_12790 [Sulfobacillus thermosulfidooxidans]OLZ22405.1 hypothetical protein BFX07_00160 [Sulfobacillus thermosulfidooxidans]SMC03317.1 hypothetical protein SAMN00768000_1024 [Sulfobacillus thermosulfidooxidans DSM 9293]